MSNVAAAIEHVASSSFLRSASKTPPICPMADATAATARSVGSFVTDADARLRAVQDVATSMQNQSAQNTAPPRSRNYYHWNTVTIFRYISRVDETKTPSLYRYVSSCKNIAMARTWHIRL